VIVVDTSAIVAILYEEPEAARMRLALEAVDGALVSAANILELQLVVAGARSRAGWHQAEDLLAVYSITIRPFDAHQLRIAREAAVKYGKGRHKAKLNLGDCFAYALAKSERLPLLCKGDDFKHTDLKLA
jgi:ribonuclease VapC